MPSQELQKERRELILQMERQMLDMPEHRVEIEPEHYFADGIYVRQITIPAGVCLTGKLHKTHHVNIVSKGRILVATEEGDKEIVAPCTFVAPPGTKRLGYALEETVWATVHASHETDLAKLEEQLIAKSYDEYLEYAKREQRKLARRGWIRRLVRSLGSWPRACLGSLVSHTGKQQAVAPRARVEAGEGRPWLSERKAVP